MLNFKQIIEAWIIAGNPTEAQRQLAEVRGAICDECPSKKSLFENKKWSEVCSECGCPIAKKIFTNDYNPCPLKKWEEVDTPFYPNTKKKKTLF